MISVVTRRLHWIKLGTEVRYFCSFEIPQKKLSSGLNSGDLAGQAVEPYLPISELGEMSYKWDQTARKFGQDSILLKNSTPWEMLSFLPAVKVQNLIIVGYSDCFFIKIIHTYPIVDCKAHQSVTVLLWPSCCWTFLGFLYPKN